MAKKKIILKPKIGLLYAERMHWLFWRIAYAKRGIKVRTLERELPFGRMTIRRDLRQLLNCGLITVKDGRVKVTGLA